MSYYKDQVALKLLTNENFRALFEMWPNYKEDFHSCTAQELGVDINDIHVFKVPVHRYHRLYTPAQDRQPWFYFSDLAKAVLEHH